MPAIADLDLHSICPDVGYISPRDLKQAMPTIEEVKKHNTEGDCWVVIHGNVYDLTEFLPDHPGGKRIILKYAGGKEAAKAFDPVHPPDTLEKYLKPEKHLGALEKSEKATNSAKEKSVRPITTERAHPVDKEQDVEEQNDELKEDDEPSEEEELSEEDQYRISLRSQKPSLSQIVNLYDFEHVAKNIMPKAGWAYYSSGADDELTLRENHFAYQRIFFKPKILVDVSNIQLSTQMLGCKTSAPFYVTATALGKLGHPDGEKVLTRACGSSEIIQMIPTLASCSFDEIVDEANDVQNQWLQLYVNSDREVTRKMVQHAEKRGIKGLFITVDAPALGRREKDMRTKFEAEESDVQREGKEKVERTQGAARAISSFIDPSLNWNDIPWFKEITKMPIVLKGVQRAEDAVRAALLGVDGLVLSNHGGRQLEGARSAIEVLAEVMPALRERGLEKKVEVFVDGGVRRATDVMKAICLGAKGVGIGRPFLYAMSTYGVEGVERAFDILKDEMNMNMRLLGAAKIEDLDESFLDLKNMTRQTARNNLFDKVYEPIYVPQFKPKL